MKRFLAALTVTTAVLASAPVPLVAQAQRPDPPPQTAASRPDGRYLEDAGKIREAFQGVLNKYPRNVGRVLRMDPRLFQDEEYLASYPAIAQFVAQYPEVARNPEYYLQNYSLNYSEGANDPRLEATRAMRSFFDGIAIFLVIVTISAAVIWLLKSFVEHRRWLRVSKIQTEVHTKLLDRFSSSEELLAYMRTPAGSRFLESAPISVDAGPPARTASAPLNRILWSVQAGVVLLLAGAGLIFARHQSPYEEVRQTLFMMGTFGAFIGLGFIVSALAAYALSQRFGLLDGTQPGSSPSTPTTRFDSPGA